MRRGEEDWVNWDWGWGQEDGLREATGHPRGMPMSSFLEMLILGGLIDIQCHHPRNEVEIWTGVQEKYGVICLEITVEAGGLVREGLLHFLPSRH